MKSLQATGRQVHSPAFSTATAARSREEPALQVAAGGVRQDERKGETTGSPSGRFHREPVSALNAARARNLWGRRRSDASHGAEDRNSAAASSSRRPHQRTCRSLHADFTASPPSSTRASQSRSSKKAFCCGGSAPAIAAMAQPAALPAQAF